MESFTSVTRASSPTAALKGLVARGLVRAGRRASVAHPALDGRQPLSGPDASDSFYFFGASRADEVPLALFARLGFRAAGTEAWLGVWVPELGLLELGAAAAPPVPPDGLEAAGLRFERLEAGRRWGLTYAGALAAPAGSRHHVTLEGRFEATHPLYDFEHRTPPRLIARALAAEPWSPAFFAQLRRSHQAHLEQLGRLEVELTVDGEARRAVLSAVRDHSFGPRRWGELAGHAWLTGLLDDGTVFNLTLARLPHLRHVLRGYLVKDGVLEPVTDGPTLDALWQGGRPPQRYAFWLVAGGRRYDIEARLEASHCFLLGDGALALHEGIAHFTVGSTRGRGISEFSFPT